MICICRTKHGICGRRSRNGSLYCGIHQLGCTRGYANHQDEFNVLSTNELENWYQSIFGITRKRFLELHSLQLLDESSIMTAVQMDRLYRNQVDGMFGSKTRTRRSKK